YIARNSLNRRVVIKECFPGSLCRRVGTVVGARSRAQQDDFRSAVGRFMQEALTLSKLSHPNIVKVHQVFEDNETAYMAMDYIEGPDLLHTVDGSAPALRPEEVIAFLYKMLDAVAYVHAQGLLHRDIAPDNILLDKATGQPILIDFGASRKESSRKTRAISGVRVVKDGYSPQEFYVSGSKQGPFSDLYALAASFYHLIAGESPKTAQERLSSIAGREGDPLRPLAGRFKAYPLEFLKAVDKAMSVFPRDRLQSVEEWLAMLQPGSASTGALSSEAKAAAPAVAAPRARPIPSAAPHVARAFTVDSHLARQTTTHALGAPLPVVAPTVLGHGTRKIFMSFTAAALLVLGLMAVSQGDLGLVHTDAVAARTAGATVSAAPKVDLTVTNMLRLPSGLAFEEVATPAGSQIMVSEVPDEIPTDLKVGDVLLTYASTGETVGTAAALREILQRELESGVTAYSFIIRRGDSTMDAMFQLGAAG
ncbi:serine/threonine-protein kinase, partial [Tabrizicola sp.]|uniref:serine/threonine-protein kinase n=1 Tax=Tabrizicola sp. TaxID=2005166 RepID=UPI003F3F7405